MADAFTNKTQVQTTAATLIGIAAGYAAGHGWLGLSTGDWTSIIGALVIFGSAAWPVIVTRAQSLKDTVGNMKNTTVVTDKASAAALPNNPDVIAATPQITAAVQAVKEAAK
jgi:hypothetical protein